MCLQLEPSEEQVIVSSSGDRTASVWDRRKLSPGVKPLATATANNTILSAYFSPAGMLRCPSLPAWIGIKIGMAGMLSSALMSAGSGWYKCPSMYKATLDVDGGRAHQGLSTRQAICAGNKTVLTTGRDNTLRLYDKDMGQLCSVPHNNNTGRWVMPLRATLGPSDTIVCGSMKRAVRLKTYQVVSGEVITTWPHKGPQAQPPSGMFRLQCSA